jgi:hypothetical protein
MRKTIATAAALCAVAALPAVAQAGQNIDSAHFKASVKGVQTNKWSSTYESQGKCDSSGESHGTEVVRFATKKAQPVVASRFIKYVMIDSDPAGTAITTRAKVTRHGVENADPTPPECEGTGGGGTPPTPDCGTKRFNYDVDLGYSPAGKKRGVTLAPGLALPLQPFVNCPVGGVGFPQMLTTNTKRKQIVAELPAKELFDKKLGEIIVRGAGKQVEKNPAIGIDRTATIEWEVTLHRVKAK